MTICKDNQVRTYYDMDKSHATEGFIRRVRAFHGEKFEYSKVEYVNNSTKVCIVCPEHGEFLMTLANHLKSKCGCPMCSRKNAHNRWTNEEFINQTK